MNGGLPQQILATASKRQSRHVSGVSVVPAAGEMPTLPTTQVDLANIQVPRTAEEAAKVLAALAREERTLMAQYESASRSRPMTASSVGLESPATPLSVYTPQQAGADLVSQAGPGAVKAVQVHRPRLSTEDAEANGVYSREPSYHYSRGRQPEAQHSAPMSRGEKLRITVPEGLSAKSTNAQSTAAQTPHHQRKSTASSADRRKSVVSATNTELTIPSFPNSPLPSPGAPPARSPAVAQPRLKSGVFDEAAFIAMVRRPRDEEAVKEADRRSRGMSTSLSTANHRLSGSSMQAFGLPLGQPISVNATQPAPAELDVQDSRKAKQRAMRLKAVNDAASDKARLTEARNQQSPVANKPPQRTASSTAATATTGATPSKLKKTGKSPANSRPPSRAATVASTKSRSRAASQVTSPLSISAIQQDGSTPLPKPDASHTLPRHQKSIMIAPEITSQTTLPSGLAPAQIKTYTFPELAPDQSRTTLIPQSGNSLSHSKSLGNFSRPNNQTADKHSLPLTMPAPPDAVFRTTARHRASSSAASHPSKGVRCFQNQKGKAYDQTAGMTGGSLALLQKMEAEVARREDASRAASRVGSRMQHSRIASRASFVLGGKGHDDVGAYAQRPVEKDGRDGVGVSKKKRGCFGCLG